MAAKLKIGLFDCLHRIKFSVDGPVVREILGGVVGLRHVRVGALLGRVFAALHQVEEADHWSIDQLVVVVAAVLRGKSALAQGVEVARVLLEIVAESTFSTAGAVVFIVELLASVLGGLGPGDLPPDVVGEVAVEAVLAVASEVVDAGVVAPFNMILAALLVGLTFLNGEVLLGAEALDPVELSLELFVLEEILVEHLTLISTININ